MLFGFVSLAILLLVHVKLTPYAFDDAYIHFRISQNLVDYGVPYFNIDEPVNASSSALWVLLLSFVWGALKFLSLNKFFFTVVSVFNAISTLAGALVWTSILTRLSGNQTGIWIKTGFCILYIALLLESSVGLMETPFALLVAGIAMYLLLRSHPASLMLLGVLPFLRPELAVMSLLAVVYALRKNIFPWKRILLFPLIPIVLLLLYELFFFRSIIPQSMIAKSKLYVLTYQEILHQAANLTAGTLSDIEQRFDYTVTLMTIGFAGTAIVALYCRKDSPGAGSGVVVSLSGLAVLMSYVLAHTILFAWYFPLIGVPLLFSFAFILLFLRSRVLKLILVLFLVPFLYSQTMVLKQIVSVAWKGASHAGIFLTGARVRQYMQTGKVLNGLYPNATLLSSEIGGLGKTFKGKIIDGAGIVTPAALQFHPMEVPLERKSGAIGAIPLGLVKQAKPELIVSYDIFIESFLKSELRNDYEATIYPVFLEEDRQKLKTDESLWGIESLYVFVRKDLPPLSSIK